MQTVFDTILTGHIAFGLISILCFWLPIIAKKGGKLHRQAGKVYVFCMWVVVISAATLCVIRIMEGRYVIAAFLGYLSLLTAQPLWFGISILRYKQQIPLRVLQIRRTMNLVIFIFAIVLIVWSLILQLENQAILLLIFGILGLTSFKEVRQSPAQAQESIHWMKEHIEGMIGTAIAAYTAFFAFGGRTLFANLFTDYWQIIPWVAPTIIGIAISRRMTLNYK